MQSDPQCRHACQAGQTDSGARMRTPICGWANRADGVKGSKSSMGRGETSVVVRLVARQQSHHQRDAFLLPSISFSLPLRELVGVAWPRPVVRHALRDLRARGRQRGGGGGSAGATPHTAPPPTVRQICKCTHAGLRAGRVPAGQLSPAGSAPPSTRAPPRGRRRQVAQDGGLQHGPSPPARGLAVHPAPCTAGVALRRVRGLAARIRLGRGCTGDAYDRS
jgi:hypothetical protein